MLQRSGPGKPYTAEDRSPEWAGNGQIAVDMFGDSSEGYYDAVLMDIRMPVMDGHLSKPVEPDKLYSTLASLIR